VYDADELDDQFATKADKEIMARDVPERLQIRIGDRLESKMGSEAFKAELDHEVDYIFENIFRVIENNARVFQDDINVKQRIKQILIFLRSKDYLYDVPMIA